MGHLDEPTFDRLARACAACGSGTLTMHSYLDRAVSVMLGDANDDGRWAHDGEGFIDGVYRIECGSCRAVPFTSDDCPRCHAAGALPAILAGESRMRVPKRCPKCNGTELGVIGFAPSVSDVVGAKPGKPAARASFGEPGFHLVAMACDDCDWAEVAEGCPMCGAPAPIRRRPG